MTWTSQYSRPTPTAFAVMSLLATGPDFGYHLLDRMGPIHLTMSTLYRTLVRLSDQGFLVRHNPTSPHGTLRRGHHLTTAGREYLREEAERRISEAQRAIENLDRLEESMMMSTAHDEDRRPG